MADWPRNEDETLLIHNPKCSKSRATLALLEERGVDFDTRLYLDEPLTRAELDDLRRRLDRPASEWVRKGEDCYSKAALSTESADEEVLAAMASHPKLLERPIVVRGDRARVGRPPEQVLELF